VSKGAKAIKCVAVLRGVPVEIEEPGVQRKAEISVGKILDHSAAALIIGESNQDVGEDVRALRNTLYAFKWVHVVDRNAPRIAARMVWFITPPWTSPQFACGI
jgi:hypothetical protein